MTKEKQTAFLKLCLADALVRLLERQRFDEIRVHDICKQAGVGRTTYYRHCGGQNGKKSLLAYKIVRAWESYAAAHRAEVETDAGFALSCFVYENRALFTLLYEKGQIDAIMAAFEELIAAGKTVGKRDSYLMAFFTYGYFGVIYRWLRYGFDQTPEEVRAQIAETFAAAAQASSEG